MEAVPGIAIMPPCIEDGSSFEANARKKALYYSGRSPGLVFADDSGISVDALGGRPGIHSARFAGPEAKPEANNEKLLHDLLRFPPEERGAHYVCVIVLAEQGQVIMVTEGRADGMILEAPRGVGGFGYDPLFLFPPLGKTFAELSPEAKFAVSHRGEAFRKLVDFVVTRQPGTSTLPSAARGRNQSGCK